MELAPSRVMLKPGGFVVTGSPTFSSATYEIVGFFEQAWIHGEFVGEDAVVVDRFLELPRIAPGQNSRAARAALGVGGERVVEQNALARHAVEVRRLDPAAAVRSGMAVTPVVG